MPWAKGQSGNPGGRTKNQADLERIARQHCPAALQALFEALSDPKTKVQAAVALLNRGLGMPRQELNATVSIFDQIGVESADRIERALEALIARAEGDVGGVAEAETLQ